MMAFSSVRMVLSSLGLCLALAGLVLNILGAQSLRSTKSHGRRQNFLLISISAISSCMCLFFIPLWCFEGFVSHQAAEEKIFLILSGLYMAYVTNTIGFTVDRWFSIAMPLKHRAVMTVSMVKIFIVSCLLTSLLSRIPFLLLSSQHLTSMLYFDVAVDSVSLIVQPITYVYILLKWKSTSRQQRRSAVASSPSTVRSLSLRAREASRNLRLLKIALLVTFSCMVAFAGDAVYVALGMTTPLSNQSFMSPVGVLLWNLVPALQPLIYIIIKPEIRALFKARCCHCKNRQD